MAVIGRAIIEIVASTGKALKEIQGLKGNVEKVGKSIKKAGQALTVGVTLPIAGMAWQAVQAASDLEEATNKLRVVFGDAADELERMLGDAPQRLALARDAAYDAAASFGQLLQVAGLTREEAAKLSPQLLQLAADMASIHNIPVEDALYKLRAGLVGETEPLRTVGILLSETAVKLKALEMGLVEAQVDTVKLAKLKLELAEATREAKRMIRWYGEDSIKAQKALLRVQEIEEKIQKTLQGKVPELTDAQKVMARYAIIMEQGAYMMGDLARTQDSVANSTRILQAEIRDLMAEVGKDLLPIAKDFLLMLRDWVKWFRALSPETRRTILKVAGLAAALGPVLVVVGQFMRWGVAIAGFVKKIGAIAGVFGKIGAGFTVVKTAIVGALSAVGSFISGAIGVVSSIVGVIGNVLGAIGGFISGVASSIWGLISTVLGAIGPIGWIILALIGLAIAMYLAWKNNWLGIRDHVANFAAWFSETMSRLRETLKQVWETVKTYALQALQWLIGILAQAWGTVVMLWNLYWALWKYIVTLLITKALELYTRIVTTIVRLVAVVVVRWRAFRTAVITLFVQFVTRVVELVTDFREKVTKIFWNTVDKVKSVILDTDWVGLGKSIVQGIIEGAKRMASKLIDYLKGLARAALNAAKRVLGIKSPSREFMKLGQASILGFVQGLEFVKRVSLPAVEIGAVLTGPNMPSISMEVGSGNVTQYHFHYQPMISLGDETEAERVLFPLFERWIRMREAEAA